MDPEMLQFLRLYNLKDKDAFLLEAVFRQEVRQGGRLEARRPARRADWVSCVQVWGFMQLPISESNEEAVGNMVVSRCVATLEKFEQADAMAEQLAKDGKAKPGTCTQHSASKAGKNGDIIDGRDWLM